ncbi:MAG: preprotein translocase subunit SecE [Patescibacteria group bacterium]
MISKVKNFLEESRQEFHRVNWPSYRDTIRMTASVIIISLAVAVFLGVLDAIFTFALSKII